MYNRYILLLLFLLLSGCIASREQPRIEYPACAEPYFLIVFKEYSSLKPEDFAWRIKQIEESLSGKALSEEDRTLLHLRLAVLLSHHKNPRPDYQRALKELDLFLLSVRDESFPKDSQIFWGTSEDKAVLRNFQSLLKEIIRLDREGKELKKKLELIKSLDIDIEKKRIKPQ